MALTDRAAGLLAFSQRQLDRVAPPDTRQKVLQQVTDHANQRPLLFAFLLVQASLALLPLLLFASFVVSTVLFAAGTALHFSLFWIGVALLLLVPTLLTTFSIGVGAWAWGVASFMVLRWLYGLMPYSIKVGSDGSGTDHKLVLQGQHRQAKAVDDAPMVSVAPTKADPEVLPSSNVNGGSDAVL
ncbi:hypothetical protein GQ53DRAFT_753741 [Thozetella sp. PMI_491]|nr:hypothetical protein GQ53DRAFT_753741 [Thozetella sp. PMI_491]